MNKTELVNIVAEQSQISKSKALEIVDLMLDTITDSLKKGNSVRLVGFGTFDVSRRKARKGRHPQTGENLEIKSRTVARFKSGKNLRDSVEKTQVK